MKTESDSHLFARILEHIPGSVIVTDLDGDIRYVNASAVDHLGFMRNELKDTSVEDLILDIEEEGNWKYIQDFVLKKKRNYSGETQLICKNGDSITCSTNAFCINNDNNEPEEIVLVFRDITEEKRVAEELAKKSLEINKMNSDLLRSNVELKRVSEMKTKFLSIASHELKTPLTSIKGYSEIIVDNMKHMVNENVLSMIKSIDRAADRLHLVINNMLDVTRIEQKRLRLRPENVNLRETVLECINELSQFALRRKITIKCQFQDKLPTFYSDKMRLHQVFTNLLSNAIKYSPDDSTIEVKIFIEEEKHFHIVVIDHGIGIDKKELKKIFHPFYEVGSTTRHSTDASKFLGGGTGLGLSIVKGIIERHGGIIWVESEGATKGEFLGSEFHIIVPIKSKIKWDDDETKRLRLKKIMGMEKRVPKKVKTGRKKQVILIIDDEKEALEISSMILQSSFEVISAESGEEGLRMAFEHKPSLILLDAYLPGMDGYRICRILRTQDDTKDTPIAFFSAATQDNEIEMCYACGGDDFIVKPFSSKEMLEKVNTLLGIKTKKRKVKKADFR